MDGVYVTGWKIDRGRSSELDKTQTGTATIELKDFVGAFDPTNTGGPYYGLLDPMKQAGISLQNPVDDTYGIVFRGFVSEFNYEMDISAKFCNVTIELVDAFDLLSSLELSPTVHGQTAPAGAEGDVYYTGEPTTAKHVDVRIEDLLTDAAWPSLLQDIFSGNVTVQEKIYERRDQALTVLQDAADAEFPGVANIFVSKEGIIRFHGRFARFYPGRVGYGIDTWKAGFNQQAVADSTVAPVAALGFRRSEADIYNACLALPLGVDDGDVPGQMTTDPTSIALYGYRGLSFDSLLTYAGHNDDLTTTTAAEETKKFSNYYATNYNTPKTRVSKLTFRPVGAGHPNATALWDLMCGVELGDLISLETNHPGGGGFDEDFYVEGIHYDADVQGGDTFTNVTLELDVSPRSFFDNNPFGDNDPDVPA